MVDDSEAINFYKNLDMNMIIGRHLLALTQLATNKAPTDPSYIYQLKNGIRCLQSYLTPVKDDIYIKGILKVEEELSDQKIDEETWLFRVLDEAMMLLERKGMLYVEYEEGLF